MKRNNGITLIALIITIIVLLILAGVAVNLTINKNGIINKSEIAAETYNKEAAMEKINLKIAAAKMDSYAKYGREATLQELADYFCEQDDIEYVVKQSKQIASVEKIDVSDVQSFFTKLKSYEYEFEILKNMYRLNINGDKYSVPEEPAEAFEIRKVESDGENKIKITFGCEVNVTLYHAYINMNTDSALDTSNIYECSITDITGQTGWTTTPTFYWSRYFTSGVKSVSLMCKTKDDSTYYISFKKPTSSTATPEIVYLGTGYMTNNVQTFNVE